MGAYATIDDLRAEGVTATQATDSRLTGLIEEASRTIDRITGWFFSPQEMTLTLDGRGTPTIEPPYPPILLTGVTINGRAVSIESSRLLVEGAPVSPGFVAPRLTLRKRACFPKGQGNIEVAGYWGYTVPSESSVMGRTPPDIRRACMLLVLRELPLLGDVDAGFDARNQWRIIEEKTRDQSYKLASISETGDLTGDPEVDRILARYRRPMGLGAV